MTESQLEAAARRAGEALGVPTPHAAAVLRAKLAELAGEPPDAAPSLRNSGTHGTRPATTGTIPAATSEGRSCPSPSTPRRSNGCSAGLPTRRA